MNIIEKEKQSAESEHMTLGELAAEDYRKAELLYKLGLDFCCGGGQPLADACAEHELDTYEVIQKLDAISAKDAMGVPDYKSWELDVLIDHILEKHHTYIREAAPMLEELGTKVARVHGGHYVELVEIDRRTKALLAELEMHMRKEEQILFPFIKKLSQTLKTDDASDETCFGTVANPIRMMLYEHDNAGEELKAIHKLSTGYQLPQGACASYSLYYSKLKEFEQDLMQHIHLENNILFPRTLKIEEEGQGK